MWRVAKKQQDALSELIRNFRDVNTTDNFRRIAVFQSRSQATIQIVLTLPARDELYVVRRNDADRVKKRLRILICKIACGNVFMSMSQLSNFIEARTDVAEQDIVQKADWLERQDLDAEVSSLAGIDNSTLPFKRGVDFVGAAAMLVVLAPVMVLVALAVRLTSPGPVLFRQVRTGLNLRQRRDRRAANRSDCSTERRDPRNDRRQSEAYGRPFVLYKFRTMRTDAEKDGAKFAVKGDPRVTSIGRFLRKSRLDELPQLWNVLRGEMSLVGPRPERPEFIEQLSDQIPNYLVRLGIKPGLTGLAQIVNGYDNELEGFKRKVTLDLHYLRNCSIKNDIKILFRTVGVVLTGKGAL